MNFKTISFRHRYFNKWINRLIAAYQVSSLPGKYRLHRLLSQYCNQKVIQHKIGQRSFYVPVDEWCFWLEKGPEHYYLDEFRPICALINRIELPFTFFDLGADVGTVSSLIVQHCEAEMDIIGFEPNPGAFVLLQQNYKQFSVSTTAVNAAVSNKNGHAALVKSDSSIDHEGFIDWHQNGETKVYTIDDWLQYYPRQIRELVVAKIDVEGQELAVIEGARSLLSSAKRLVLIIEIHPEILKRDGLTPESIFLAAESIRRMQWRVPLFGNTAIDRNKLFFEQFAYQQYDIIGLSH